MLPKNKKDRRIKTAFGIIICWLLMGTGIAEAGTLSNSQRKCEPFCATKDVIVVHDKKIIDGHDGIATSTSQKKQPPISEEAQARAKAAARLVNVRCDIYDDELKKARDDGGPTPAEDAECVPAKSTPAVPPKILEAWRTMKVPPPKLTIEPYGKAWLRVPEIAYTTSDQDFEWKLNLPTGPVTIHAHVVKYIWNWDDGVTTTSKDRGKPWPDETVTHAFLKPGKYRLTVTAKMTATWETATSSPQQIPGMLSVTSAPQPLTVVERHSVLVSGEN